MDEESKAAFKAAAAELEGSMPHENAVALHELFIKLTDGGFTENQTLKLLAYFLLGARDD